MKAGHYRLASPTTALALGGLSAALALAMVPLYRADPASGFSAQFGPLTIWLAFATVGVLVASRQPRNVMGWILLGTGFLGILNLASTLYEFLVYRRGDSGLPLGAVSIFLEQGWSAIYLLLLPLSVFLFRTGACRRDAGDGCSGRISRRPDRFSPSSSSSASAGRATPSGAWGVRRSSRFPSRSAWRSSVIACSRSTGSSVARSPTRS